MHGRGHVASVDTGIRQRNQHIVTEKLFDADAFPHMTLHAIGGALDADGRLRFSGTLTIRDTTRQVELVAAVADEDGRLRLRSTLRLDRTDYGLTINGRKPGRGRFIGHDVTVEFDVLLERKD